MKFEDLNLHSSLLKAVKDQNYSHPTAIQKKAIPLVLKRNDVLGSAQTGTGKTAAFALPILHHLVSERRNNKIRALVVTPTRELAIQIGENFTIYSKYNSVRNTVIFGGVKQGTQTNELAKGVEILIATPGRLLDLIGQGFISLKDIGYFVLDEACHQDYFLIVYILYSFYYGPKLDKQDNLISTYFKIVSYKLLKLYLLKIKKRNKNVKIF